MASALCPSFVWSQTSQFFHSYHREIKRFHEAARAFCPPFPQMGSVRFQKKKRDGYPKARFEKRGAAQEENDQGFLLRFQSSLQKKVSGLAAWYQRCQRRQVELNTLLYWSGARVAIQTQINRGGTLELMIEEGGGGVSEGGLSAPEPRSPEK